MTAKKVAKKTTKKVQSKATGKTAKSKTAISKSIKSISKTIKSKGIKSKLPKEVIFEDVFDPNDAPNALQYLARLLNQHAYGDIILKFKDLNTNFPWDILDSKSNGLVPTLAITIKNFTLVIPDNITLSNLHFEDCKLYMHGAYILRYVSFTDCDMWDCAIELGECNYHSNKSTYSTTVEFIGCDLTNARIPYNSTLLIKNCKLDGTRLPSDLSEVNLSGSTGILDPSQWLRENFEFGYDGIIVFKSFASDTPYLKSRPKEWKIEEGQVLTETVNYDRNVDCGCGVNFGTFAWVEREYNENIWKCLIRYDDLASVVVPYETDGKARCARLQLLEKIK